MKTNEHNFEHYAEEGNKWRCQNETILVFESTGKYEPTGYYVIETVEVQE